MTRASPEAISVSWCRTDRGALYEKQPCHVVCWCAGRATESLLRPFSACPWDAWGVSLPRRNAIGNTSWGRPVRLGTLPGVQQHCSCNRCQEERLLGWTVHWILERAQQPMPMANAAQISKQGYMYQSAWLDPASKCSGAKFALQLNVLGPS